jgi:hypothetical protein
LVPVADEKGVLQVEEALKLRDFVQHRQARSALDDQKRREVRTGGAEPDALERAVDIQRARPVDYEWCPAWHGQWHVVLLLVVFNSCGLA